jgi:hypothetical protein
VVTKGTENFTFDGRLEEMTESQVARNLTYGVQHTWFRDELDRTVLTRGYDATLYVDYEKNAERRIIKESAIRSNSDTEYTCTRSYDSRGNRLSRVCVNPGGGSMGRENCTYDAQGRLASRIREPGEADYFVPGNVFDWWEGFLNLDGPGLVSREYYEYGPSGEYLLRREWREKDSLIQTHHLTFQKGKLALSLVLEGNGDTVGTLTYAYDEKGIDPKMANWIWRDEFRYAYDIQGNWTSRESFFLQGGQPPQRGEKMVRNVFYY